MGINSERMKMVMGRLSITLKIVGIMIVCYMIIILIDKSKMERLAKLAKDFDMNTGECIESESFFFGGTACVDRDKDKDGYYIAYIVYNDKYKAIEVDLNKSKIIGVIVGEKSSQFMKGFADEQKTKSRHD